MNSEQHDQDIIDYLRSIEADADDRGIYLKPPLPVEQNEALWQKIRDELNIVVPREYLAMLSVTNGIDTQIGYLSDLDSIGEHNAGLWFMDSHSGVNETGNFQIQYTERDEPKKPTHIWLGYDGNSSELLYHLKRREFWRTGLGDLDPEWVDNNDRSLLGLLRYMTADPD